MQRTRRATAKGKPETATAQSQEAVKSTSTTDSKAIEPPTLMTAVGQILKEKMVLHSGPHALELNWYETELWDPLGPHYCNQRTHKSEKRYSP